MLTPRIIRSLGLVAGLGVTLGIHFGPPARADLPPDKPFVVPQDRAEWDARRPSVLAAFGGDPGQEARDPSNLVRFVPPKSPTPEPGVIVEHVLTAADRGGTAPPIGLFVRPVPAGAGQRFPLVVLLVDSHVTATAAALPGWDGRSPALVLARFGFATLVLDETRYPITSNHSLTPPDFGIHERRLPASFEVALARPEVDPSRVAVVGLGWTTGLMALRLMAFDPRITCGVAAIESGEAVLRLTRGPGEAAITASNQVEALAALCAPRPLNLMVGEALPLPPGKSVGKAIERAAKGTYRVYGKEGEGRLSFTHYGEFAGHDSVSTRLQWMAAQEWLDKHFRPQGPTPLGHAPEPEPTFDPDDQDVLNLTEAGIAGWASEMSARDSTWTWRDGVVACRPQANEYGWLRSPVAVDDFLLSVEWKVPARGNAGIFLRAQPVAWTLPPTEENKLRVSTLGLTWPSRTGLELQTQDDPGIADRYSTGSMYRHAAPATNPTRSPDQWNRSTVRARGPRVEVWNNGIQVLDADLTRCSDTLPVPPLRGYFGFQNHGNAAEYRAVRLKRLSPDA